MALNDSVTLPRSESAEVALRPDETGRGFSRAALWVWLALFLPTASIYHPEAGWNVNTRLDLVFALVDQGTVRIDDYHDLGPYATGDKALFGGHYYSDKVFGLSILGVPAYVVLRGTLSIFGIHPGYDLSHWWVRIWTVGVLGAGTSVLLWFGLLRLGVMARQAFLLVCISYFGTLLLAYSTVYYPYLPGLFLSLLAWDRMEAWAGDSGSASRAAVRAFLVGLFLGGALLMDYIFGLVVVVLSVRAFWLWRGPGLVGRCVAAAIGGFLPVAAFGIYTVAIFGSLAIPYQYESDPLFRIGMSRGFMGVTGFQGAALYYLTVHPYRGLFFYSPILVVGLMGSARLLLGGAGGTGALGVREPASSCGVVARGFGAAADERARWVGGMALVFLCAYLLFNASYYMWWGGWAMGPRLVIPAIPFVALGVAGVWTWGRVGRAAVIGAGVASVALTLPPALVDPQTPMWLHKWPELLFPTIGQNLAAEQFLQMILFWRGRIDPTLGSLLGLPGLWALAPTLALWAVPAGLFLRTRRGGS